jgi:5-enolpyruvylshikimate-3-phosphate synthase
MLEAITTSTGPNKLLLEALEIETYRPTEQNVEVLERNGRHMRAKNTGERLVVRSRATAPLNPVEILVEVESVVHGSTMLAAADGLGESRRVSYAALQFYRQIRRRSS